MAEKETSNDLYPLPWLAQVARDLPAGAVRWILLYRVNGRTAGYQPTESQVDRDDPMIVDSSDEAGLAKAIAASLWSQAHAHWSFEVSPKTGAYAFAPVLANGKQGSTFAIGGMIKCSFGGDSSDTDGGRLVNVATGAADRAYQQLARASEAQTGQLARGFENLTGGHQIFDSLLGTVDKIAQRLDDRVDGRIEIARLEAQTKLEYARSQAEHLRRSQIIAGIQKSLDPLSSPGLVAQFERVAQAASDKIITLIHRAGQADASRVSQAGAAQLGRAAVSFATDLPSLDGWLDAGMPVDGQLATDLRGEWLAASATVTLGREGRAILDALG
jgi:hypothetical protein